MPIPIIIVLLSLNSIYLFSSRTYSYYLILSGFNSTLIKGRIAVMPSSSSIEPTKDVTKMMQHIIFCFLFNTNISCLKIFLIFSPIAYFKVILPSLSSFHHGMVQSSLLPLSQDKSRFWKHLH